MMSDENNLLLLTATCGVGRGGVESPTQNKALLDRASFFIHDEIIGD